MRRILATILAIGYLAFVPFCFFGTAAAHAPTSHSGHEMHQTTAHHAATEPTPAAPLEFHADMYADFTGTPLAATFFALGALLILFFLRDTNLFTLFTTKKTPAIDKPPKRRAQILLCRQYVTAWLARRTLSPTFA